MKKICVFLILIFVFTLTGCSNNVTRLVESKKYEEALAIMEKSPEKYGELYDEVKYNVAKQSLESEDYETAISLLKDNENEGAQSLLEHTYNLRAAIRIEAVYNEMLNEIEEYNPDKWTPSFDYMDESDFYKRIYDMLNETRDIITRDGEIDNAKENLLEIFGYVPASITEAKDAINQLSTSLEFDKYYNSPFCYYQALNYVMDKLTKDSEFVRFEMTDTSGFMIIEQPYNFLQSKGISEKIFAYLLGICKNMGAEINRDFEKITVTFKNVQTDSYYSRGYFYCAPNSQHSKITQFIENASISIDRWGVDDIGVWMDITLTNQDEANLKYLSVDAILVSVEGEHLETASVLLRDINDKEITFSLEFKDITMQDLKEKNCNVLFFPAIVLSN